ncbi:MAG: M14 family metallopeptidase, partial [candidate division KSB1 bacterium]|nr:M14 family metallopeptidase [candidate division KSB1 bacterium]
MKPQEISKLLVFYSLLSAALLFAQETPAFKAVGAPSSPRVQIAWNRYYDSREIGDLCRRLAEAFPECVRLSSIGKSAQGRDLYLLTVTSFRHGDESRKPALYIDGNIHSNEIQGSEAALYTAWFLAESFGRIDWITDLLKQKTFYIVPTINPDARDEFMHRPNTPHSPRSGMLPRDDDGDGAIDEDPPDDLDGDGFIVMMRRRSPVGRWKADPDDPRLMVRVADDVKGDYELLGYEGIDNDEDGRLNEDGPGYYDPNRNWGWNWQPMFVQEGADFYPFSIPENRAVNEFVKAHPNIAGAQSYHNAGGMILRGPGQADDSTYLAADNRVYDALGKLGEEILPGYKYMVLHRDLYSVYGGELDWFYGARGIFTFTNELWTSFDYYRRANGAKSWFGAEKEIYRFDELLLFGEGIVPWKSIDHPQFGRIEIGGIKKSWTRTAPSFMLEEMCHRNMAFTLFHAYHLPQVRIDSVAVKKISDKLWQIDVRVINDRLIPTRSAHEVKHRFTRPDRLELRGCRVVAGYLVENPLLDWVTEQKHQPDRLSVDAVPGLGSVQVRWIVSGRPTG